MPWPSAVLVSYQDDPASGTVTGTGWRAGRGDKGPRRCFEVQVTTLDR